MYKPQFPYLSNQVIISSGRVVHHSYDDFIFLFGKKGVAISSPATLTVDANERTILASLKIELGYQAESKGEPVLLGRSTVTQLGRMLDSLKSLSVALSKMTEKELEKAIPEIVSTSKVLADTAGVVKGLLESPACLSNTTFTK